METVLTIAFFLLPYLLGSVSAAVLISKGMYGKDIRTLGSNNAGSTNMFAQLGFKAGLYTQIIDILKGMLGAALPFLFPLLLPETPHCLSHLDLELQSLIAGLMAVVGHIYPVFFGFRGGKGINTLLGMMVVTNWMACLVCIGVWVLALYLIRYVAIASMVGVLIYPLFLIVQALITSAPFNWLLITAGFCMFLTVVFTHRANIGRLLEGKEPKNHWFEGKVH